MNEIARVPATSSAVERGDVPEVAALGKELSELFNTLGVTQRAYALRTSWSESLVSRSLSGKRLATQDFIDRLIRETEAHHNTSMRPEVRQHLRDLRLAALKVSNPAEYQLEALRDELAHSNRKVTRLIHREEALHLLIEKKENELQSLRGEVAQAHSDWTAEQVAATQREAKREGEVCGLSAERDDLMTELEELREDLHNALHLREKAERQSVEFRERVLLLEEQLAERTILDGVTDVPLEEFRAELFEKWTSERVHEVSKALTEAAWSRQLADVVALVEWLQGIDAKLLLNDFVENVARLRPVEDVISAGFAIAALAEDLNDHMQAIKKPEPIITLCDAAASSRADVELSQLANDWREITFGTGNLSERLLARAVNTRSDDYEVVALWDRFRVANIPENEILRALSTLSCKLTVPALLRLLEEGHTGRARQLLISAFDYGRMPDMSALWKALLGISPAQRSQFTDMVANSGHDFTAARYMVICARDRRYDDVAFIAQKFASQGRMKSLLESMSRTQEFRGLNQKYCVILRATLDSWDQMGHPAGWDFSA
ncbi:hypothetical protein [Streptomyces sp. NPDC048516]|uniref:hypothetical protein n=1 Tax=Streptomyces sp. NPDC048516 TaxID=3365565 RepID=UPI00371F7B11